MRKIVSRNKMSGKARKVLDREKRNLWTLNPVTRVRESGKVYNRKRLGDCRKEAQESF
jgi:hypothetical protein